MGRSGSLRDEWVLEGENAQTFYGLVIFLVSTNYPNVIKLCAELFTSL